MPHPYAFLCGVTQIAQMTQIFYFFTFKSSHTDLTDFTDFLPLKVLVPRRNKARSKLSPGGPIPQNMARALMPRLP